MSGVEYGDDGVKSPFTASWGTPVGSAYSEERARWVKRKVRQHIADQSMQEMRQRQVRVLNLLRREYVERLGEYVERLGDDAP